MPNPRYMSSEGEPTVELLDKLTKAKQVYFANLPWFCDREAISPEELRDIQEVFLIGSHAEERKWKNSLSDLDLKLVNPSALPENLHRYKRRVLDPILHQGEKFRWIDLFFARESYQVTSPRFDLTSYWDQIEID